MIAQCTSYWGLYVVVLGDCSDCKAVSAGAYHSAGLTSEFITERRREFIIACVVGIG